MSRTNMTRLTVHRIESPLALDYGHTVALCRCQCRNFVFVRFSDLRSKHTTSCGCTRQTHGQSHTPEYKVWSGLLQRTTNRHRKDFRYYGARGIAVCKRWKKFQNFLSDMGRRPKNRPTIDRIDNDENYTPSNCRWATHKQQARNRSPNRKTFLFGKDV